MLLLQDWYNVIDITVLMCPIENIAYKVEKLWIQKPFTEQIIISDYIISILFISRI